MTPWLPCRLPAEAGGKGLPPPRPLSGGHISEELLAVPRFSPSPPWRARAIAFAKVVLVCRARGDRRAVGSEWLAGGAHERRERRGSARTLGSSTTQTLDHSRAISLSVTGSPCSYYSRMSEGDRSGAEIRFLDDNILDSRGASQEPSAPTDDPPQRPGSTPSNAPNTPAPSTAASRIALVIRPLAIPNCSGRDLLLSSPSQWFTATAGSLQRQSG